jgi:hypothetical protein
MPKQKDNLITVQFCIRNLSAKTVKLNPVSSVRFHVYAYGAYIGAVQQFSKGWGHFTETHDRVLPTQQEAAESLCRWAFNKSPQFFLGKVKFVNGDFFQEDRDIWEPAGQKAPDCFAGVPIS